MATQSDWLRRSVEVTAPARPGITHLLPLPLAQLQHLTPAQIQKLPPVRRHDLVLLETWEQPVTVVEDSELRERALSGPDSAARIRRMRRVHVISDIGTDNPMEGLAAFATELGNDGYVTFEDNNNELFPTARLTVTPVAETGDLPCGPQPPSGYLGHEDQAIRVEMRGDTSITWGFGSAAPLYRVKLGVDLKTITFLNQPRDARLAPRADQIVEIIPWGAKLCNDEKVAELTGQLFQVAKGYNSASRELELGSLAPQEWVDWLNANPQHWNSEDPSSGYFYLRLWDRGSDTSSGTTIDLANGPVELGHTGLQVRLSGKGRPGDYWVVPARRATPNNVVPWQLMDNDAPVGPRRFFAPLAIIEWEAPLEFMGLHDALVAMTSVTGIAVQYNNGPPLGGGALYPVWRHPVARVIDGRCKLQRLCVSGCCTITVGDGEESNGMVNSLQEALDLLPSTGGKICLLPGLHDGEVELDGVTGVTIAGCGPLSKLQNVNLEDLGSEITTKGAAVVTLTDCQDITLKNFSVVANRASGVEIRGVNDECKRIRIEGLEFTQDGAYTLAPNTFALPQPAVLALGGEDLTVVNCRVQVEDKLSYTGALVLGGIKLRIHDNWVQAGAFNTGAVADAMGGIHVLSQSVDVEVARNVVHGGWGFGVALGHALGWVAAPGASQTIAMSDIWTAAERGLGEPVSSLFEYPPVTGAPLGDPGMGKLWTPAGHLVDVRLDRNRISAMGLSGISTGMMRFSHIMLSGGDVPAFIVVAKLLITNNHIHRNLQITSIDSDIFAPRGEGCCDLGLGGLTISAGIDCTVAQNRIVNNGADHSTPSCGLGFVAMQNLVVVDNYVVDNGLEASGSVPEGFRGGIAIQEVTALRGDTYYDTIHFNITVPQPSFTVGTGSVALKVHKNEVAHRTGKALWVRGAFNDVQVTENSFTSKGDTADNALIDNSVLRYGSMEHGMGGACVQIIGLSPASEVAWTGTTLPTMHMVDPGQGPVMGGTISFCDNRGLLDWTVAGGHAAAYLLSSLDSVVVSNNFLEVDTHQLAEEFDEDFVNDVMAAPAGYSFVVTNCYVGAACSVQVRANRFREGLRDALLSVLAGPAVAPTDATVTELREASLITSCVGDHCGTSFSTPPTAAVVVNNVFINRLNSTYCVYTTHNHEQLGSLHIVGVTA
ncbi:hypothetical protein [Enhygromyxa salina]|uniref:hypothetical protein n=1 Tax=Enhygromyxa salina TaxID=215803 RepID=UPI0011BAB911|nr:hypothetical protein [Enhygromyxa salina]